MQTPSVHLYIVDDDPSFGKSLKRLLNARGMSADCFTSARSFLDSVPSSQQGCAIIDIHMPELNGFELMDKMRELHYSMPKIVISGQAQAGDRNLAINKGAVGFLLKPFSAESLFELLAQAKDQ